MKKNDIGFKDGFKAGLGFYAAQFVIGLAGIGVLFIILLILNHFIGFVN